MRRLIALVPGLLLLVGTIPAQAYPPRHQTAYCLIRNRNDDGTVSAAVEWEFSDAKGKYLLDGLRVNDTCHKYWVQIAFRITREWTPQQFFTFYVQPGAHQTLGKKVLESLGVYHRAFFRWAILNGWEQGKRFIAGGPVCTTGDPTPLVGFILADGSILECPHT